jgi:hypothetical protein
VSDRKPRRQLVDPLRRDLLTFFLLIALVVASVPARAVPASAATSASTATTIAGRRS